MIKYPVQVTIEKALPSRARPAIPVTMIVLHATGGSTFSGAYETLVSRGLSYHYLIEDERGTDGLVHKCVATSRVAFHAGNSYGPNEKVRGVSLAQDRASNFVAGCSVNNYTIGISFVNRDTGSDPYSRKQYEAAVELILQLATAFPLAWVTTHALVSPMRKVDPNGFDIKALASEVGLPVWRAK